MLQFVPRLRLWASLFGSFARIAPLSFGGGFAMLPVLQREIVHQRNWLSEEEFTEVISVSGVAPGGVGVNASAFIGYKLGGVGGAAAAVCGMILPTFVLVMILTIGFSSFRHYPKVNAALEGIQMAVLALIAFAGIRLIRSSVFDGATLSVFAAAAAALLFTGIHPLLVILLAIAAGLVLVAAKIRLHIAVRYEPKPRTLPGNSTASSPNRYPEFEGYFGEGI
ncbi:chromate transporter [Paenibacillus sp. FJAT-26967]|uniref:chromate transporter n=1 Tax=Paenibacillus sp. FJAT-26967 TaxID=1729690 RepID=UPI000837B592|nr:chromate transporter [Paenibacillus sp. FJAT-26967]